MKPEQGEVDMSGLITGGLGPVTRIGDQSGSQPGMDDVLVSEKTLGGPLACKDVRMYLDRKTLKYLLEVAESSTLNRAQLNGVGVKIRLWKTKTGHHYETWQLVCEQPQPESFVLMGGG